MKKTSHFLTVLTLFLCVTSICCAQKRESTAPVEYNAAYLMKIGSVRLSENTDAFMLVAESGYPYYPRTVVAWKAPDQLFLVMLDPRDNTPVAVVCEGRTLIYDPMNMKMLSEDMGGAECEVKLAEGYFKCEFTIPSHKQIIDLDFGSVLNHLTHDFSAEEFDDGKRFLLEGKTDNGNKSRALITPSSQIPLDRLELYQGNYEKPLFTFSLIDDVSLLDQTLFQYPEAALGNLGIPITKADAQYAGLNFFISIMVRAAIVDPSLRTNEQFLSELAKNNAAIADTLRNADEDAWKRVENIDSRVSEQLRMAFSTQLDRLDLAQTSRD